MSSLRIPPSEAEQYFRRDPEEERFYEIFFQALPEIRRPLDQRGRKGKAVH